MTNSGTDSASFEVLTRELLSAGSSVRFEARGASMSPMIRDAQIVHVTPVIVSKVRYGDIVLTKGDRGFLVHRLVVTRPDKNFFITRGDCGEQDDAPVRADQILGQVVAKEIHVGTKIVRTKLTGFSGTLLRCAVRGRSLAGRVLRARPWYRLSRGRGGDARTLLGILSLLLLLTVSYSHAQVVVDASTSGTALITGISNGTVNFTHTTTATANRL